MIKLRKCLSMEATLRARAVPNEEKPTEINWHC